MYGRFITDEVITSSEVVMFYQVGQEGKKIELCIRILSHIYHYWHGT